MAMCTVAEILLKVDKTCIQNIISYKHLQSNCNKTSGRIEHMVLDISWMQAVNATTHTYI